MKITDLRKPDITKIVINGYFNQDDTLVEIQNELLIRTIHNIISVQIITDEYVMIKSRNDKDFTKIDYNLVTVANWEGIVLKPLEYVEKPESLKDRINKVSKHVEDVFVDGKVNLHHEGKK